MCSLNIYTLFFKFGFSKTEKSGQNRHYNSLCPREINESNPLYLFLY